MNDPSQHPLFQRIERHRRRSGRVREEVIVQAHGGGGKAMRDLIEDLVVRELRHPEVDEDQAQLPVTEWSMHGDRLAFTTDSYVVTPLEFPGGDIGALAVNGTVNDLAVGGARPMYLSCGLVIEEGLEVDVLRRILRSMGRAAETAGVRIVTGDTKVVPQGKADRLFINTSGIGVIPKGVRVAASGLQDGDAILVNGFLGDHGAAILSARGELKLDTDIPSDCAPLHEIIERLCGRVPVHAMRDVTRGGLAAVLNEWALASEVGIMIDAAEIPVRPEVAGFCELLGLDPLHLANEGKFAAAVPGDQAGEALAALRSHPLGTESRIVGYCRAQPPGIVTLDTGFGGERILDMLVGEPLPRIC